MRIAVSINMPERLKDASVCVCLCVCVPVYVCAHACVCPQLGGYRARCVWWGAESQKALLCLCSSSTEALEVSYSYFDHPVFYKPTTLYASCLTWRLGLKAE